MKNDGEHIKQCNLEGITVFIKLTDKPTFKAADGQLTSINQTRSIDY